MSAAESMHALSLSIEDGCVYPEMVCPHEGKTFTPEDAPDCRRFADSDPLTRLSDNCLAVEAWGGYGVDCLEVEGPAFQVTQYPIPVTYRWDGYGEEAEFYVSPAAVSVPGREPVYACGDRAGSPEHHSSDADGSHNFSPVPGQEGKA